MLYWKAFSTENEWFMIKKKLTKLFNTKHSIRDLFTLLVPCYYD